jgi:nucleoside-diphosphate-sugar epimerase
LVSAAAGRPDGVVVRTPASPGAARDIYLPDLTRTTGELGLQATIDIRQAVHRTLDWYRTRRG